MTGRICDFLGKSDKEFCQFCPYGFLDSSSPCPIYDSRDTAFKDMVSLAVRAKFVRDMLKKGSGD